MNHAITTAAAITISPISAAAPIAHKWHSAAWHRHLGGEPPEWTDLLNLRLEIDHIVAAAAASVAGTATLAELKKLGQKVEKDDGLYLVSSRQAFIWPYNDKALLTGEHLYEDKSTLTIEEIDPAEYMTPERVREIHKECLAAMEARMGPHYWVYRG